MQIIALGEQYLLISGILSINIHEIGSSRPNFMQIKLSIKEIKQQHEPRGANLCGLEPQLIKLEFIIYLPKLKVSTLRCFS